MIDIVLVLKVLGIATSVGSAGTKYAISRSNNKRREAERKRREEAYKIRTERGSATFSFIACATLLLLCHFFWWPSLFINNSWWMWILIVVASVVSFFVISLLTQAFICWIAYTPETNQLKRVKTTSSSALSSRMLFIILHILLAIAFYFVCWRITDQTSFKWLYYTVATLLSLAIILWETAVEWQTMILTFLTMLFLWVLEKGTIMFLTTTTFAENNWPTPDGWWSFGLTIVGGLISLFLWCAIIFGVSEDFN